MSYYDVLQDLKALNRKAEQAFDVLHAKYHASKDKAERKRIQTKMDTAYMMFHKVRARIMGLRRKEDEEV